MPIEDRPYEKFEKLGSNCLTDAELISIIIKNGGKELNCLEISKYILGEHSNGLAGFNYLKQASIDELMKIPGIGKVKAIQLKCVVELAERINGVYNKKTKIKCPKDIFGLLGKEMGNKQVEEMKVVLLDSKAVVKSVVTVSLGAVNKTTVSLKEMLSEPIKQLAASIIIVHNHPSGDTTPSRQDILMTKKVKDYTSIFDIQLLDHIIIGKDGYTSIKETNNEIFLGGSTI